MKMIVPMQRFGEVEDIGNCALYLASPAAAYMTGWTINVDGGIWLTLPNMMFGSLDFVKLWSRAKL